MEVCSKGHTVRTAPENLHTQNCIEKPATGLELLQPSFDSIFFVAWLHGTDLCSLFRGVFLKACFLLCSPKSYCSASISVPDDNFTSKHRESLATAFSKVSLQEGSQESRTRTAFILQEQILWYFQTPQISVVWMHTQILTALCVTIQSSPNKQLCETFS